MPTEREVLVFSLGSDGSLDFVEFLNAFNFLDISGHGEIVDVFDDIIIVNSQLRDEVFTHIYDGQKWKYQSRHIPESGESCAFEGFEIT